MSDEQTFPTCEAGMTEGARCDQPALAYWNHLELALCEDHGQLWSETMRDVIQLPGVQLFNQDG